MFFDWLWKRFYRPKQLKSRQIQRTILLVEDEPAHAKMAKELIKDIGSQYKVLWAKNGQEALDIINSHEAEHGKEGSQIGLILLDLKMPIMNGPQFLKELRNREHKNPYKIYCPVVFLTAYEDEDKWDAAYMGMAAEYLRKPFNKEDLSYVINRCIEEWDAEELMDMIRDKAIIKKVEYRETREKISKSTPNSDKKS